MESRSSYYRKGASMLTLGLAGVGLALGLGFLRQSETNDLADKQNVPTICVNALRHAHEQTPKAASAVRDNCRDVSSTDMDSVEQSVNDEDNLINPLLLVGSGMVLIGGLAMNIKDKEVEPADDRPSLKA